MLRVRNDGTGAVGSKSDGSAGPPLRGG